MQYLRFLLFPFTLVYIIITSSRNWLYDRKIKRSFRFSLPIINVGNLSMGGTGKTPHIELLIRMFKDDNKISTLSRGYGRKQYGFQLGNSKSSALTIGDEPMQFYHKFGNAIEVAVDVDRVHGVSEICLNRPEVDLVLLDDAYQHRAIQPGFNMLLTSYSDPFYDDFVLPMGNLRERRNGKNRADIIVVTKSPVLSPKEKKDIIQKIKPKASQKVFFSQIKYGEIKPLTKFNNFNEKDENIILVTGIAKPEPLLSQLEKSHKILKHFNFPDHYSFKEKDMGEIYNLLIKFADKSPKIVTTEKDAMRLLSNHLKEDSNDLPWFYQEIEVVIDEGKEFKDILKKYVQENSRDY
ncbi:tetraacyldisaccharide 4'-kinase [Putridiphycobacter roseus]|uniref:Tetraacyldisaccharide 4'-kinase n=1 Tax=Putridiphycobacter roseus TaxID=2219161 RepID=A0A2W1NDY8_9FLAO|nr:tetraacyldisaccharide 4'-kinase [Putridiphycobacter roseus]PZE17635.1 tetraacyldisaccharide 4'-kinase [Putridiphycobacter roseus]